MLVVNMLLFGSSGNLGNVCRQWCEKQNWTVYKGSREVDDIPSETSFDAVVWAQGSNLTKSFEDTTDEDWMSLLNSNLLFVVRTLRVLLQQDKIVPGARLVVISSVWEKIHRCDKSAYIASKAALGGLVRALSSDLGKKGISINCVSPGVVLSPMTAKHLKPEQISQIEYETPGSQLVTPLEVAKVVNFLISKESSGINGQSIFVDNGWSDSHSV